MAVLKKSSRELFPGAAVKSSMDAAAHIFLRGADQHRGQSAGGRSMKDNTALAILDAV
jgi:hypothetical protein